METRQRLLAVFCMAVAMSLGSCTPDEPATPVPQASISLKGTSWEGAVDGEYTYNYGYTSVVMTCDMVTIVDILDDTEAELFTDITIESPDSPLIAQQETTTAYCSYTFDGSTLRLINKENGHHEGTLAFQATDTTFSMPIRDASVRQICGTDSTVLRLLRGAFNL